MTVEIYTTHTCPYCVKAKKLLDKKGIAYQEINVSDPKARDAMRERSNGARTVPQIFIHGRHIGGCDDLFDLEHDGKLDAMLKGQTPSV